MLQVFSDLEDLVNTHFYLASQFQLDNFKSFLVEEGIKTSAEIPYLQEATVRVLYYNEIFGRAHKKVVEYIDSTAATKSKEPLALFVEMVYVKVGNLKKKLQFNYSIYLAQLKAKPDNEQVKVYYHMEYMGLEFKLNDLFDKIKSTYGHLLSQKTLTQFDEHLPFSQELIDLMRKPFDDDFEKDIKQMREDAYKKPTIQQAIGYLLAAKASLKQAKIKYAPTITPDYVKNSMLPDNSQRLSDWLDLEIEHLKQLGELYKDTESAKGKSPRVPKVKTDLTVAQLAFLFDLCRKEKIIIGSQTDVEAFVVAVFGSKRKEDISKDSLHNKLGELTDSELDDLKSKLAALINAINAKQTKNKKK